MPRTVPFLAVLIACGAAFATSDAAESPGNPGDLSSLQASSSSSSPSLSPLSASSHVKWFTFYGQNASAQQGILNLLTGGNLTALEEAYTAYNMPGIYNIEDWLWQRPPHWNMSGGGLLPDWDTKTDAAMIEALPLLKKGVLKGIFLGDEPACAGVPAANVSTVASYVKSKVGDAGFVYINECERTFNNPDYPGYMTVVPAGLDYISIDTYDLSDPAAEAGQAVDFYNEYIFPKMASHQLALVVPGTFGNSSESVASQDPLLTKKMQLYWNWVQNETRIVGLNPWHWNRRSMPSTPQYELGASQFPQLVALMKEIGQAIARNMEVGA